MNPSLSSDELRRLRLRSQRLRHRSDGATVEDVVSDVLALQAQDPNAATLGVRVRSDGPTASDVEAALYEDRSVIRTWCMRGTLHLVATEDVPWLLSLFGPVFVARGRRRLAELGFDDEGSERAVEAIRVALDDHGPLTRAEICDAIREADVDIDPRSQAIAHLVRRAALLGVACKVAPKDGDEAYGLLDEWVSPDDPPDRETALSRLARRYLVAYQPASLADFAAWSKLPMSDARRGWELIAGETTTVDVGGGEDRDGDSLSVLATEGVSVMDGVEPDETESDETRFRLLPAFDAYLLGYATRERAIPAEYHARVHPGGGMIRPTVVLDGRGIATWRLDRTRGTPSVVVSPFDAAEADFERGLSAEVDDLGRFLDTEVEYRATDGR